MVFVARFLLATWVIVACAISSAWAQQHSFERFADELGGRQSSVYDIFQDPRGFLWFAGDTDGLLRYDGYQLTRWAASAENDELGRVSYSAVVMTQNDELWAAAWGSGLLFWQHNENRFRVYNTENSPLPDNRVQTLFEDSQGRIWAGTLNGLAVVEDYQARALETDNPLYQERIWRIAEQTNEPDSQQQAYLWFATTSGLYRTNQDGGEWQQYLPFPERYGNNRINEIRALRIIDGRVWVGVDSGVLEFNPATEQFIPVQFSPAHNSETPPRVNTLYPKGSNQLWVGAENGLWQVNTETHEYIPTTNDTFVLATDVDIRRIATDNSGTLWLGARDQGIFHSLPVTNDFQLTAESAPEPLRALLQRTISTVHVEINDDVWFGIPNGVARWQVTEKNWQYWLFPADEASRRVESVETDHTGRTWVATNSSLYFIDEDTDQLTEATEILDALGIQSTAVTKIFQDSKQRLWLGFWGQGLAYYDITPASEEPQVGWHFTALNDLRGDLVYDLVEQKDIGLWLVTRFSGLWFKPLNSEKWHPFQEIAKQDNWRGDLPSDGLLCLFLHRDNELWLCSENGLIKLDLNEKQIKNYTRANGLPSDRVLGLTKAPGIEAEAVDRLWITTSRGISLYEREREQFLNFGDDDGLSAFEFLRAAVDVNSDGRIYAGTVKGTVEFNPNELEVNRSRPNIGLSRIAVDDEDITGSLHFSNPELYLARNHRSVVVHYSVLDFKGATANAGRYRLLGLNDEWSAWSEVRQITFTTLPTGEYTLEIDGRSSLGLTAEKPLQIRIVVERPWWASPWVWLLAGILLLISFVVIAQVRFAALARLNRRLDKQVKERTQELEALAQKLREQSQTDYLTTLPNRRGFTAKFETVIAQAKRDKKPLTLVMFDVDHFKQFNDQHGHDAGDQVLHAVSKLAKECLREQDIVGRWGGEEFAILLPDTPLKGASQVCESLRSRLEGMRVDYQGESLNVTATFGVYQGDVTDTSLDKWMQYADIALYQGKKLGRNRVNAYAHKNL
ncbi:hypothetical protein CWE08_01135 [Aliidiomarina iranensis]|uniref:diguanylate cyclase n=1 Tax=Aliidiomarina iranensis TaxID=1434071 RepID=A0A432W240_9GAMM|nr:ligand-binding sensor domain-containing diguanylate cyclase [Aliidiomarina iranensis]RUO23285.1 hypothetical protein CWE08_01135 [Aliidiomarina iranensis]